MLPTEGIIVLQRHSMCRAATASIIMVWCCMNAGGRPGMAATLLAFMSFIYFLFVFIIIIIII